MRSITDKFQLPQEQGRPRMKMTFLVPDETGLRLDIRANSPRCGRQALVERWPSFLATAPQNR